METCVQASRKSPWAPVPRAAKEMGRAGTGWPHGLLDLEEAQAKAVRQPDTTGSLPSSRLPLFLPVLLPTTTN